LTTGSHYPDDRCIAIVDPGGERKVEQVQRFCDLPKKVRGGGTKPHGERVPNDEPTLFAFRGVEYEVDLCGEDQAAMQAALQPYIDIAKKAQPVPTQRQRNGRGRLVHRSKSVAFTSKDVRNWLAEQGRPVAPSGRIAKNLIEEYEAAHERQNN
jgi:hypothetical protein